MHPVSSHMACRCILLPVVFVGAGKTLWCPESKGFPRKVKGSTSECVCVPTVTATNTLQLFPGCAPTARKCHFDTD